MDRWASWILVLFGFATPLVGAQAADPDSQQIHHVIEAQWQAFVDDDAETAFSFASPDVRESFGTAANFLATVRKDYPMVYRHVRSQFLDEESGGSFSFQLVKLSGADGAVWLVVYQMQKQDDGTWRIGGVVAVPRADLPNTGTPPDST